MSNKNSKDSFSDIRSGIVVFLVALPLCLGIAMASGVPLFSGIISGIIGGIVVGFLSGSRLSVTGPAAGLTAIILSALDNLKSFEALLLAVFIAGIIQFLFGLFKAGSISNYFPSNVIEGMLTGIGIIIIIKQIPVALGYSAHNEILDFSIDGNRFPYLIDTFSHISKIQPVAIIITASGLLVQILWMKVKFFQKLKALPSALIAVLIGILINEYLILTESNIKLSSSLLVNLPEPENFKELFSYFVFPDFTQLLNTKVYTVGITIAIVASIETLLSIEASDKLDPNKKFTDTNRELKAQGIGNILSSLVGGIPMTSVIVRTSANINSGAKSKISTISHGIFLLVSVLFIPTLLNKIPLASLASVLLMVGYKLASPRVFKHMWIHGKSQFFPFIITVLSVVFMDLLNGVAFGLCAALFFLLKTNLQTAYRFSKEKFHSGETITIVLAEEVSFLNKAAIKQTLFDLPENSNLIIDASHTVFIDFDVIQLIKDFLGHGYKNKNIKVKIKGFKNHHHMEEYNHVIIN